MNRKIDQTQTKNTTKINKSRSDIDYDIDID